MFTQLSTGAFAGMSPDQLRAIRVQLQAALVATTLGRNPQVVSYGTGDGQKSVTTNRTTAAEIRALLAEVNAALGGSGRRARPVYFG